MTLSILHSDGGGEIVCIGDEKMIPRTALRGVAFSSLPHSPASPSLRVVFFSVGLVSFLNRKETTRLNRLKKHSYMRGLSDKSFRRDLYDYFQWEFPKTAYIREFFA